MTDPHLCSSCGHEWVSADAATARAVRAAAKVNGQGAVCSLCYHLEMAGRHAEIRGFPSLAAAMESARAWKEMK